MTFAAERSILVIEGKGMRIAVSELQRTTLVSNKEELRR